MQQINAVVAQTHQRYPQRQAAQIKRGEIGVFLQFGKTADQAGQQRHQNAGGKTAQPHRRQAQPRHHIADGGARQHRMA